MLSINKLKALKRLHTKKERDAEAVFIAEGSKLVADLLNCFACETLLATPEWISENTPLAAELIAISEAELKKISLQKTPQQVFAVFKQPKPILNKTSLLNELSLALDDIQDPGNLGTIFRIADWFGIEKVFCSLHCADIFNPKTIQASMGAIGRIQVFKVNLPEFLAEVKPNLPLYGSFLSGQNIYDAPLSSTGIIVMGNEGKGISQAVEAQLTQGLFIPSYPSHRPCSESLNVATATAIICAEFRRR